MSHARMSHRHIRVGAYGIPGNEAGAVGGFFDGHPLVNWRHENLMRLFFRALRAYVKPGGIVKARSCNDEISSCSRMLVLKGRLG